MLTRRNILSKAFDDCMKELYSFVQPSIDLDEFVKENKIYIEKYRIWEKYNKSKNRKNENPDEWESQKKKHPDWEEKSITKCIGPRPCEFYYIPKEILKDIVDNYVYAYKMDEQQNLLDIIEILKKYCEEPIVDKYIEGKDGEPGHRSYDRPDNLQTELQKIIIKENPESNEQKLSLDCVSKFFEFLDMAGEFYNWNSELNSFNTSIYLGASPNTNKEIVIKNWKEFRDKDISIDEEQIKKEYYGEELD